MIVFNKNYLGHNIIRSDADIFYICTKCNSVIHWNYTNEKYFFWVSNWVELENTCDEMIIKNIIE